MQMTIKICDFFVAITLTLSMAGGALAQSPKTGDQRTGSQLVRSDSSEIARAQTSDPSGQSTLGEPASLESLLPRDGLRIYIEIRNGGLAELVKSPMAPFGKLLSSGPIKTNSSDLMSFVMANLGALSNSRVAVAGYGAGAVVLIETAGAAEAERLHPAVATLLGRSRKGKASEAQVEASLVGRVVLAGSKEFAGKLSHASGAVSLADDQEFTRARARFEHEQFFVYVDLNSMSRSLPGTDMPQNTAYTAGAMAALTGMPSAIAIGGSISGETATVRASMVNGSRQGVGLIPSLFSSLASAAQPGHPMAGGFASADADVFVDVMLDWDKLFDAIQTMLAMFASSFGHSENANANALPQTDILGMAEASLGFSIKHDLIPTLGGELAFSLSGLSRTLSPKQAIANGAKPASPRFTLMVALKDPANFEKLIARIFNRSTSAPSQFTRTPYRGVGISANKSFAYAIVNGFFIAGGSAAQVRRAIDAQATGVSLSSTEAFKSAFGSAQQAILQAYVSPVLSNQLFESLSKEAVRSDASAPTASAAQQRMPIAVQLVADNDGMIIEARLPTNLAVLALASVANSFQSPSGIRSLPGGIGVSEPGPRDSSGPRTPKMTDEDVRRRP
jgi:hypothetical protein